MSVTGEITTLTSNYYCYYPSTLTTSNGTTDYGITKTSVEYNMLFNTSSY